ncbi:unnamed protein product [Auanema sp. JU1783]|nr:unnamed protein product [Auanema sp. JU1783]
MGAEVRRTAGGRQKKATPPILSHEFVIQNHGDIMSCVLMLFVVGLMFPTTSTVSAWFVAPQYNHTIPVNTENGSTNVTVYLNGLKDLCTIFFYTVAWVVAHAVIQEYVLDKFQRKAHLSKVKTFKFTESGHHIIFAAYSAVHAFYVIMEFIQTYSDIKRIWLGYPDDHKWMSLSTKLFAILQIAYWLHQFPEFYFQKFKREEMRQRSIVSIIYIGFIGAAYIMNFLRVAAVLLFLEYASQTLFHIARIAHFIEKKSIAKPAFKVWNIAFILVRLASTVLTVTIFWYGLRQSESAYIDVASGNFNTTYVRINSLFFILFLQLVQLWNFISFHIKRFKDNNRKKGDKKKPIPAAKPLKKARQEDSEEEAVDVSLKTKKKN